MANLKRYASRRTDDEWYRIIMDCRKSGLSDTRWCQLNDIRPTTFFTAVKRLRDSSYSIPERTADDIYDLTEIKGNRMFTISESITAMIESRRI